MSKHSEEIERLRAEADRLERLDREFAALPEEYRLAITLHEMMCHHNHVDGCSWEYEGSQGRVDWNGHAHSRYLQKALVIKGFCQRAGIATDKAVEILKIAKDR